MARPRKWASDAERKRAERAGTPGSKGSERSEPPAENLPETHRPDLDPEVIPGAQELIEFEGRLLPVIREPKVSEEAYVGAEILATKMAIEHGLKDPDTTKLGPGWDGTRVDRARAYAKWRYAGYRVGEIATL